MARRADEAPERRVIHGDYSLLEPFESFKAKLESFQPVTLAVPSIEVDATDGYDPTIEEIVAVLNRL
jgi:hypothetical protein